jgi:hypothetical protein
VQREVSERWKESKGGVVQGQEGTAGLMVRGYRGGGRS